MKKLLAALCMVPILSTAQILPPRYLVTNGVVNVVGNEFTVASPSSRVEFPGLSGETLYIKAKYKGTSVDNTLLESGQYIEQFGIKLRNVNQCNLVYVMRRFSPKPTLSISYKKNTGQSTYAECADRGYTFVKSIPLVAVNPGATVNLSARFYGNNKLTIWLDGKNVFNEIVDFDGKGNSGFRSDNTSVSFVVQ